MEKRGRMGGIVILVRCKFQFLENMKIWCNIQVVIYPFLENRLQRLGLEHHVLDEVDVKVVQVQLACNKERAGKILSTIA